MTKMTITFYKKELKRMHEKEKLAKDKEYSITSVQFFMKDLYIKFSYCGTKYELTMCLNTTSRIYEFDDSFWVISWFG